MNDGLHNANEILLQSIRANPSPGGLEISSSKNECYLRQSTPDNLNPYCVFISYGSEDRAIVDIMLYPGVKSTGAQVFLDVTEIEFGDDFRSKIISQLKCCQELLVLISPSSMKRSWVIAEIGASMIREIRIVAIQYGVGPEILVASGLTSVLGTTKVLPLQAGQLVEYFAQLKRRVSGGDQ